MLGSTGFFKFKCTNIGILKLKHFLGIIFIGLYNRIEVSAGYLENCTLLTGNVTFVVSCWIGTGIVSDWVSL